jgi:hypothetical protein
VSPKEHRDRLFKNGRPLVRRLEILDGDQYSQDISILWAAYKSGSFSLSPELTQERFVSEIEEYFSKFNQVWIVDDRNSNFAKGRGQVGLVLTNVIDLIVEARFGFFTWATHRNILRAAASFLNMIKHSTRTGICLVRASGEKRVLPDHLKDYELLHYIGKSAKDEYLYSVRGRA